MLSPGILHRLALLASTAINICTISRNRTIRREALARAREIEEKLKKMIKTNTTSYKP